MTAQKSLAALAFAGLFLLLTSPVGAVEIDSPWARPTAPGAKVGAAFMSIVGGPAADRVISASSPVAVVSELHSHVMENGVAKMRALPAIDVPAGGRVELKPGGLHLMLIQLRAPLKAGEKFPLTLRFEKAGERTIEVPITAQAPESHAAGAMKHEMHGKHQP